MTNDLDEKRKLYWNAHAIIAVSCFVLMFLWLLAYMIFEAKSVGFFFIIIGFYVFRWIINFIASIHVKMLWFSCNEYKIEEQPKQFYFFLSFNCCLALIVVLSIAI